MGNLRPRRLIEDIVRTISRHIVIFSRLSTNWISECVRIIFRYKLPTSTFYIFINANDNSLNQVIFSPFFTVLDVASSYNSDVNLEGLTFLYFNFDIIYMDAPWPTIAYLIISAYVTPDVMYGGVSSTDFTFCHCTVFVGSYEECIFESHSSCTLLMAYDSALVIALYVVIQWEKMTFVILLSPTVNIFRGRYCRNLAE